MNIAMTASKGASRELRKSAVKIRDLARDYAPEKTGALESAIEYATTQGAGRRNVFTVYIDLDRLTRSGRSVGEYAWIMEEELHPHGRQKGKRYFTLGPGSRAKAAGGKKVGGRFLSRAVKEGSKDTVLNATVAVQRVLNSSRAIPVNFERDIGEEE